jgi:hypothetical protein
MNLSFSPEREHRGEPLSVDAQDGGFKVPGLGYCEHLGVILSLAEQVDQGYASSAVGGRLAEHVEELGTSEMIGARGGKQVPGGMKNAERAQVDLLVAAHGLGERAPGFGKGGRVEHDGVEVSSPMLKIPKHLKGIPRHPLDVVEPVEGCVFRTACECICAGILGEDVSRMASQMHRE